MTTKKTILHLLETRKQLSVKELKALIPVSESLIHRHLRNLKADNTITAIGSPPKVFYRLKKQANRIYHDSIEQNWLEILPDGTFLYGGDGFERWCKQRKKSILETEKQFVDLLKKYESLKKEGLIPATSKITKTFSQNFLDEVWYTDFYSWEIFGKTKLGKLVLYAKQNSDKRLMKAIAERIKTPLQTFIDREGFDQIIIIPHSVPRRINFLETTTDFMQLSPKPMKTFEKKFVDHAVAQKTLKSKEDRVQNAESTLFLPSQFFGKKILLIDDACGSGATLNIAAKKIKAMAPGAEVHALTFVGSQNGFEVIAES